MGAPWEQVGGGGGGQAIAALFEKGHVPGEGRGIAGDVDDAAGGHAG